MARVDRHVCGLDCSGGSACSEVNVLRRGYPAPCPKCGGELLDLRGCGFNADQARRLKRCFVFNDDAYECRDGEGR